MRIEYILRTEDNIYLRFFFLRHLWYGRNQHKSKIFSKKILHSLALKKLSDF